jgi:hypothetical protein
MVDGPIADIYRSMVYSYDQEYEGVVQRASVSWGGIRRCGEIKISYYYVVEGR